MEEGVLPLLMELTKHEAKTQQLAFTALRNLAISRSFLYD